MPKWMKKKCPTEAIKHTYIEYVYIQHYPSPKILGEDPVTDQP